jgi:hypothetical protein
LAIVEARHQNTAFRRKVMLPPVLEIHGVGHPYNDATANAVKALEDHFQGATYTGLQVPRRAGCLKQIALQ